MNEYKMSAYDLAKVLFVEDSKNEYLLNMMILRRENVEIDMDHVRDGVEALEYLHCKGKYKENKTLPDLIILDKRLIMMDGDEVLRVVKQDKKLKNIPIIMFSGVIRDSDSEKFRKLGALGFFEKPVNFDKINHVVDKVKTLKFRNIDGKHYLCRG